MGKTLDELWPETGQDFAAICRRVLRTGEPHQAVDELNPIRRRPDGPLEPAWSSWSLHRVRLPGDQGWGLVNAAWETTARRRAEAAVRESEERLRMVIDNSRDGINMLDLKTGRYIVMSPTQVAMTGFTAEELEGMSAEEVHARVHPDDREVSVSQQRKVAAGEDLPEPVEYRCKVKSGEYRWFSDSRKLVRDANGQPLALVGVSRDITARKQAEEALRESEERLRRIARAGRIGFFEWNAFRDVSYWNQEHYEIFGYEPGSLVTHERWLASVHPDDREGASRNIAQLLERTRAGQQAYAQKYEYRMVRDGTVRWLESEATLDIKDGEAIVRGCLRDVTERKTAEAAVQEERDRLAALVNSIHDEVWFADAAGRFTLVNPAGRREFDLEADAATDVRQFAASLKVLRPDGTPRPIEEAPPLRALRGETVTNQEETIRTPATGEVRYRQVSAAPVRDGGGHIIGSVSVVRDITERKQAEEALRESEERLRLAQTAARVGIWDWNLGTGELRWTRELEEIYALEPGGVNTYEDFRRRVHPEDLATVEATWDQAVAQHRGFEVEFRILQPGGKLVWIHCRGAATYDGAGAAVRVFGVNIDITERKLAEAERAQQARLKDEFLALLGHELRNPLAAISTAMHLLSKGVTAARRDTLDEMIGRQVMVLQRLVDDLLDLARVTRGQIELKKERIDLSDFLQTVSAAARSAVVGRGQELVVRMPAGYVRFMADGVRLEQIVTNLLGNASKYTDHGGRIELSGAQENSDVVIRCKDNGRGIPLGMQRMIFEPFTRVQLAGRSDEPGVGIGLALVKRLVELHGGTVSVESGGSGTGSEFSVRLPLMEPPPVPPRASVAAPAKRIRLRIAIVEDNPDVAQTLAIALEQAGHRVSVFGDGPTALAGLARLNPGAILVDVGLPGMDGYELAAKLRRKRNLKQTLFVGLSGFKRRALAPDAKDDFDQYFVKPVDLDKLLSLLDAAGRPTRRRLPKEV